MNERKTNKEKMFHTKKENGENEICSFRKSRTQIKRQNVEEDCINAFVEKLHNTVWPNTNVSEFSKLLNACNAETLEIQHGGRQETLLHR